MSSLDQRRESPRRRELRGMHPGWACFLMSFFAGLLSIPFGAAFGFWMAGHPTGTMVICVGIPWIALMIGAGKQAEKLKLMDRP